MQNIGVEPKKNMKESDVCLDRFSAFSFLFGAPVLEYLLSDERRVLVSTHFRCVSVLVGSARAEALQRVPNSWWKKPMRQNRWCLWTDGRTPWNTSETATEALNKTRNAVRGTKENLI
jgi:hypothetical protein